MLSWSPTWPATIAGTTSNTIWSKSSPAPAAPGTSMLASSIEFRVNTNRGSSMSAQAAGL